MSNDKKQSEILDLLKEVANTSGEYDSEYDGRMYSYCVSCNYNEDTPHGADCIFEKAKKLLHSKQGE